MTDAIKPMLAVDIRGPIDPKTKAHKYTLDEGLERLRYPKLASFKADGVRCTLRPDPERPNTRSYPQMRRGDPIPNHHIRRMLSLMSPGLDGELAVLGADGAPDFRATTGAVRRRGEEPDFIFYVFDTLAAGPFSARDATLKAWVDRPPFVHHLNHFECNSADDVRALFGDALSAGWEGLILRCPEAPYKHGRATLKSEAMLKVKPYLDSEAVVVGFTELRHNTNEREVDALGHTKRSHKAEGRVAAGVLGTLEVIDQARGNTSFEIGTGFTARERADLWANRDKLMGAVVKYQYLAVGGYDSVRSGSFKGFREAWDMD